MPPHRDRSLLTGGGEVIAGVLIPTMPMDKIPKLSVSAIKHRIDGGSFQRGEAYFRSGAIFDTRRQGSALKARCEGSQGGPYRVEVTFDGDKIGAADCSCPVGGGGLCKHVAALLLT